MSSVAERRRPLAFAEGTWLERLAAALPLATVFFWLCLVYWLEAWGHLTPWLFTDELEMTQLSRAIAATGHAARRGEPHSFDTLYTYLLAPAWWIDSTERAYSTAKYLGVVWMTSALFPAYFMARRLVSPRLALFAAAGTAAVPALVYAPMFVSEPLAYPYSTLCLFLIVEAFATRRRGWFVAAIGAAAVAPFVRGELAVIPAVLILAALATAWRGERARRWRARWSLGDWIGALTLLAGALILFNSLATHRSYEWLVSTTYYKGRMVDFGLWSAGALAIGLGVLPAVAGLASLLRPRGEPPTPEVRAFATVFGAAVIGFGWYTAVKASYISTVFSTLVEERNLIYLAPLCFVGTALVLQRRRVRLAALVPAAGFVLYTLLTTPYEMQFHLYSDAPGLAILQAANRTHWLGLTPNGAKAVLVVLLALSVAAVLLLRRSVWVVVAAAAVVLAWNASGQVAASMASNSFSSELLQNFPRPLNWVDEHTGGAPTLFLGQQDKSDPNGIYLLEFWNRSIQRVWSLDGTAPGPGPTLTPDLIQTDGTITPAPGTEYAVVEEGIGIVGDDVASAEHLAGGAPQTWRLVRISNPLRLSFARIGVYADGWMSGYSSFAQYEDAGQRSAIVTISRRAWGGKDIAGHVTIAVGTVRIGKDKEPHLGRITKVVRWTVHAHGFRRFVIPAPRPPFRVEVRISPTFVPAKLDPHSSEQREFGAQVSYAAR